MVCTILSCDVVAIHGFNSHNYVAKRVNKQVEAKVGILSLFRDQRTKKQRNKGTANNL